MSEPQAAKTPLNDLRKEALEHYDDVSSKAHHWSNDVPRAIDFYYDYKQKNIWQRLWLAFASKKSK